MPSGSTVYIDGGSTLLELARILRERTNLTIVTNSLSAAVELSGTGPRVVLVGGELRRRSQTMVGPLTRLLLQGMHVDIAFMGTIGLNLEDGMTTTDDNEAFTKELAMEHAGKVVLLAHSAKAGQASFARVGHLDRIDTFITDHGVSPDFVTALKEKDIDDIVT